MAEPTWRIRESADGVSFGLRVQTRAGRTELAGFHGEALKLKVAAPALEGAANRVIVEFFSKLFSVPKSNVRILSGDRSRDKIIRIGGLTLSVFLRRIPPPPAARG